MSQGRFEKVFLGMIMMTIVIGGFSMWGNSLFTEYSTPTSNMTGLESINKTAQVAADLQVMWNSTQTDNTNLIEQFVFSGWTTLNLVFTSVSAFLLLPANIAALLIPDKTTADWIGGLMEVFWLGVMVWGLIALFIRNSEGTV